MLQEIFSTLEEVGGHPLEGGDSNRVAPVVYRSEIERLRDATRITRLESDLLTVAEEREKVAYRAVESNY